MNYTIGPAGAADINQLKTLYAPAKHARASTVRSWGPGKFEAYCRVLVLEDDVRLQSDFRYATSRVSQVFEILKRHTSTPENCVVALSDQMVRNAGSDGQSGPVELNLDECEADRFFVYSSPVDLVMYAEEYFDGFRGPWAEVRPPHIRVPESMRGDSIEAPQISTPRDLSWCVAQANDDLVSLGIGASAAAVANLQAQSNLGVILMPYGHVTTFDEEEVASPPMKWWTTRYGRAGQAAIDE